MSILVRPAQPSTRVSQLVFFLPNHKRVVLLPCLPRPLHVRQNETEVCDVLIAALSQMLKDREAPSSSHASCNGPVAREEAAPAAQGEASGGEGGEGEAEQCVLPEDRQRAIELLREGEASVLRFCLAWVEVRRDMVAVRVGPMTCFFIFVGDGAPEEFSYSFPPM